MEYEVATRSSGGWADAVAPERGDSALDALRDSIGALEGEIEQLEMALAPVMNQHRLVEAKGVPSSEPSSMLRGQVERLHELIARLRGDRAGLDI